MHSTELERLRRRQGKNPAKKSLRDLLRSKPFLQGLKQDTKEVTNKCQEKNDGREYNKSHLRAESLEVHVTKK